MKKMINGARAIFKDYGLGYAIGALSVWLANGSLLGGLIVTGVMLVLWRCVGAVLDKH